VRQSLVFGIRLKRRALQNFKLKSVADYKDFKLANAKKFVFFLVLFYLIEVSLKIHKQEMEFKVEKFLPGKAAEKITEKKEK